MAVNNQGGLIVNPLKTDKMVGSAGVSLPNTMAGFGEERQTGQSIQQLGVAIQKIRDFQDKTLGMNFLASIKDDLSQFEVNLASKRETYQNDGELNTVKQKINDKIETYRKIAQQQGYDADYVDAYITRAKSELQGSENNFLIKNLRYQEEQAKENYFQGQLLNQQTNERYFVSGNYGKGIEGFNNILANLNEAVKLGLVEQSKQPMIIKESWKGMLIAQTESLINTPNGASMIEEMSKWDFNQFAECFKELDTKIGKEDFGLGSDEYDIWKSGLRSAYATIQRNGRAEKEMSWIEEQKMHEERAINPYKAYAEKNGWLAGHEITSDDIVGTNNDKYGTNLKTLEDFKDNNLEIVYPDTIITGMDKFYNDPNNSSEAIMLKSYQVANRMVGGLKEDVQIDYFDSVNKGLTYGSLGTRAYFTNPTVKVLTDETYTPENREIIGNFKDVKDTSITSMSRNEIKSGGILTQEMEYNPSTGMYNPKINWDSKIVVSAGGKFSGIEANAFKGDKQAIRFRDDILKYRTDNIKIALFKDTGGIITEDLVDEAELKKSLIGQPIIAQSKDTQQKLMDAYLSMNEDFKEELDGKTEAFIDAGTAGFKAINFGKRGVVFLDGNIDVEKAGETTTDFIDKNKFYIYTENENGEKVKLEVPKSEITFSNRMGKNELWLEYMGKNLVNEKGEPQSIKLDEIKDILVETPKPQEKNTTQQETTTKTLQEEIKKEDIKVNSEEKPNSNTNNKQTSSNETTQPKAEPQQKTNEITQTEVETPKQDGKEKPQEKKEVVKTVEQQPVQSKENTQPKVEEVKQETKETVQPKIEEPKKDNHIKNLDKINSQIESPKFKVEVADSITSKPQEKKIIEKAIDKVMTENKGVVKGKELVDYITKNLPEPERKALAERAYKVLGSSHLNEEPIKPETKITEFNPKPLLEQEAENPNYNKAKENLYKIADEKYRGKNQGVVPLKDIENLVEKEKLPKHVQWMINEMKQFNPKTGDKRVKYYHDKVVPNFKLSANDNWCATSLLAAFMETGTDIKFKTASAQEVYKNRKEDVPMKKAVAGDVLIFRNRDKNGHRTWTGHVNTIVYRDDNYIVCIGGNQSDKDSKERNGQNYINFKVYSVKELEKKMPKQDLSIIRI